MSLDLAGRGAALAARALAGVAGRSRRGPGLSILIFHRVLPAFDPLFPNEIDGRRFDRMMALVARSFLVLPLDQAAEALQQGRLPRRALAITFDDGYADNCDIALPILRRHGLTATIFVATGFLDGGRMWNDSVIECLRRSTQPAVDLAALGLPVMPLGSLAERRAAIERCIAVVKYQRPPAREPLLAALHDACGRPALPEDLMLSGAKVRALHEDGMGIGAHTQSHPILRTLGEAEAEAEITGSRQALQNLLQQPVDTFAYPNGKPGQDFDQRHVELTRRLGFRLAVSTAKGVSRQGDDMFQLKRFTPWQPQPLRWLASLARHHAGA